MKKSNEERVSQDYKRLVEYCVGRGWVVDETEKMEAEVEFDGHIKIGSLITQPLKLYSLLHEVGHLEVWDDDYDAKYPGYTKSERHKQFQVAVIEEEIKAWDNGLALARELGIDIDMKKWHAHRCECIYSYVRKSRRHRKVVV